MKIFRREFIIYYIAFPNIRLCRIKFSGKIITSKRKSQLLRTVASRKGYI